MGAAFDRSVNWKTGPQVGRFYGDFLCMRSFRKIGGPLAKFRGRPDFLVKSKAWGRFSAAGAVRKPLESLEYFCAR
jgi:hypothetical protein